MKYKVTDRSGNNIEPGDFVTDFRGEKARFERVSRPPVPGKSAKVQCAGREYYANVFDLTIEVVDDDDAS